MTEEERNLLEEIQKEGGSRYVPGDAHPGGAYVTLKQGGFLEEKLEGRTSDGEGGYFVMGRTFSITPKGEAFLENGEKGVLALHMKELIYQLTDEQAEFLVALAERMLEPIQTHIE